MKPRPPRRIPRDDALVYSSEKGRVKSPEGPGAGDGVVRVRREVKGRRGKTMTTIQGVPGGPDELRDLAADLKRRCGSGGSVKDGVIEIQGDHVQVLLGELETRGYRVKRAGG